MEKPVVISIKGMQRSDFDGEDTIELVTQGTLSQLEEGYDLSYQETYLTGLEGTVTTFHILPDRVILSRRGSLNSEMVFEVGQKHVTLYETPYGSMMMGIKTWKAHASFDQTGGDLSIHYAIEIENTRVGENTFEIHAVTPENYTPTLVRDYNPSSLPQ